MFDALETGLGLEMVLWLQSLRNSALEVLVTILDYMGEELLYIALIALVYWAFSKKLGTRLVFILLIASFLTAFAKDTFATERPYEVSALVNETVQEESYGIPSGHALISLAVWAYLAYALKRRWLWVLVGFYVLLQSFGRMTAGAHYPQDVVFAWLLGGGLLLAYIAFAEKMAEFWKKAAMPLKAGLLTISLLLMLGIVALMSMKGALPLTLPAPCPEGADLLDGVCYKAQDLDAYYTSIGLFIGSALGVWFENSRVQFKPHSQAVRRIVHYLIGLGLAMALLTVLGAVNNAIAETGTLAHALRILRYALVAFFALALWPWLSLKFGLMEKESGEEKVANSKVA